MLLLVTKNMKLWDRRVEDLPTAVAVPMGANKRLRETAVPGTMEHHPPISDRDELLVPFHSLLQSLAPALARRDINLYRLTVKAQYPFPSLAICL